MKYHIELFKQASWMIVLISLMACHQTSTPSEPSEQELTESVALGIFRDSAFANFLDVKLPQLAAQDSFIQIELNYHPGPTSIATIYKSANDIQYCYRGYGPTTNRSIRKYNRLNELIMESELLGLNTVITKSISLEQWNRVLKAFDDNQLFEMPSFIADYVLGSRTTMIGLYDEKELKYTIRFSKNDTLNKIIQEMTTWQAPDSLYFITQNDQCLEKL